MLLIDDALLMQYRMLRKCEWCGKKCAKVDPSHIFTRGSGRIDHPFNIVGLGSFPGSCGCHQSQHNGNKPTVKQLLDFNACKYGVLMDDIEELIFLVRRHGLCGQPAIEGEPKTVAEKEFVAVLKRLGQLD